MQHHYDLPSPLLRAIWSWQGPERVRLFRWKLGHHALLTNEFRFQRNLSDHAAFPRCNLTSESLIHVFRDCHFATDVWIVVGHGSLALDFFSQPLDAGLLQQMRSSELIGNTPWALIFTITLDNIWYARNNLIFHQHALTWEELTFKIPSICSQILESHSQERCFGHTTSRNMFHPPIWWFPPQPRAFKLNCDGSVLSSTEKQLVEEC